MLRVYGIGRAIRVDLWISQVLPKELLSGRASLLQRQEWAIPSEWWVGRLGCESMQLGTHMCKCAYTHHHHHRTRKGHIFSDLLPHLRLRVMIRCVLSMLPIFIRQEVVKKENHQMSHGLNVPSANSCSTAPTLVTDLETESSTREKFSSLRWMLNPLKMKGEDKGEERMNSAGTQRTLWPANTR